MLPLLGTKGGTEISGVLNPRPEVEFPAMYVLASEGRGGGRDNKLVQGRIAFAPPRKSYQLGLLFTHKNSCGGKISQRRSEAGPR